MRRLMLIICCVVLPAFSQPPAPSAGESAEVVKGKSPQPRQQPSQLQRGTKDAPLFVQGAITTERSKQEAERQAEESKDKAAIDDRMALYTATATIIAGLALIVAASQAALFLWQLRRMEVGLNAAMEANRLAQASLHAEQRPWVALHVRLASGLAHDAVGWDAGVRWHLEIEYELRHLGRTPALNVSFMAHMMPSIVSHWPADRIENGVPTGPPIAGNDIASELSQACSFPENAAKHGMGFGRVLFPGQTHVGRFRLNGNEATFEAAKTNQGFDKQFLIVASVTYSPSIGDGSYRTAQAFHLYRPRGDIALDGEGVPIDQLKLVEHGGQDGCITT